jgi:hypothetical protein
MRVCWQINKNKALEIGIGMNEAVRTRLSIAILQCTYSSNSYRRYCEYRHGMSSRHHVVPSLHLTPEPHDPKLTHTLRFHLPFGRSLPHGYVSGIAFQLFKSS